MEILILHDFSLKITGMWILALDIFSLKITGMCKLTLILIYSLSR
jgi:hypothetical protein